MSLGPSPRYHPFGRVSLVAQPAKDQERADVEALIRAMGSGHFTAERVHRVHSGLMANTGRPPMAPVRLGQVLGQLGVAPKPRWDRSKVWEGRDGRKHKGSMMKGWVF